MNDTTSGRRRTSGQSDSASRLALLAAGRECVRTHGLAKTTSRLIAGAAGVNLGSITYYFGSKDALLAEALFGELSTRLAPVMDTLEGDDPAASRLLGAVQELIAEFEASAHDVPVYLNALVLSTEPGLLAERARALLSDLQQRLATVIARLATDGVIARWVDPQAMASLLLAAANGIALQTQLDPDGPTAAELAGQLAGLLLAAATDPPTAE
ncbi:MAG: TetR/AcrR family transcriptional regulator [Aquihabitans sp.]